VISICSQCGAVLTTRSGHCRFCDTSVSTEILHQNLEASEGAPRTQGNLAVDASLDPAWRAELSRRLAAYRTRRRKSTSNSAQSALPFERAIVSAGAAPDVAVAESPATELPIEKEFAFTVAIGRALEPVPDPREPARMEIDVSLPFAPETSEKPQNDALAGQSSPTEFRLYPVASLAERRIAAFLDAGCLLLAFGGFLTLFGSLGGQFTLSKLSAAVYTAAVALFYLQYFALFTILGGNTPGMMLRGLQVVSFSGEPPTPRQLLARSAGYVLSAASFLLGFLWACWDEDHLTWHDRISRTYLAAPELLPSTQAPNAARNH
jgi:uncharacterized RDD family membrane protein YckC